MRKPSLAVLALASLASGMTAASAADLPVKGPPLAPVVAPAPLWAGWYFGGNFGYGFSAGSDSTVTVTNPAAIATLPAILAAGANSFGSVDPQGVVGGLQVGYNWQFGPSWVLGIVADFQGSGINESNFTALSTTVTAGQSTSIDWFGTVRGKLGWAAGNWLFYGTGGVAYGEVSSAFRLAGPAFIFSADQKTTKVGWTAGGGIDYAVNRSVTVGVEYLFLDLGNETATATGLTLPGGAPTAASLSLDQRFASHIVRGTINWHFAPY